MTANALILASAAGHAYIVEYLLSKKVSAESIDHFSKNALMYACQFSRVEVMELLIKNRALVNRVGGYMKGSSPLIEAATAGHVDAVNLLLKNRANVNLPNKSGLPAVHYAAMHERTDMVKHLITRGAKVDLITEDKYPLLAYLFYYIKDIKILKELVMLYLDNGADPNGRSMFFQTCLMHAASLGDLDIVRKLAEKGADINAADKENDNALLVAIRYEHPHIAQYLIEKDIKISSHAANKGINYLLVQDNIEFMPFLVNSGADLNTEIRMGYKAIHLAVMNDKPNMLAFLVKNGADINAKCGNNKTALDYAIERNNGQARKILESAGARSQIKAKPEPSGNKSEITFDDYSSFLTASKNGDLNTLRELVKKGMHVSFSLSGGPGIEPGMTPLMLASRQGHVETVRFLLENRAVVSTTNSKDNNKTALQYALENGHKDIADLLRKAGAK